jgi:hypothetical protein
MGGPLRDRQAGAATASPTREKALAVARETWETWRSDPAATQWTRADTYDALDTLRLIDRNERGSLTPPKFSITRC